MSKSETVLVTGATGFIGSALCRELIRRGYRVRALHRATSRLQVLEGLPVERVVGDIREPASLAPALRNVSWVMHVAAESAHWRRPEAVIPAAVEGTRNTVEAARAAGVRRLVLTSSLAAMGLPKPGELLTEKDTYQGGPDEFPYAYAKRRAEVEALSLAGADLEVVIVNPSIVLGPGDLNQISGSLVVEMARGWGFMWLPGGVNYVHVADVVEGHLAALRVGRPGERYVLGGENLPHREALNILAQICGRPRPWLRVPGWSLGPAAAAADIARRFVRLPFDGRQLRMSGAFIYCDSSKARRELGLGEPLPFRQAAQETYDWYRAQGVT